MSSVEGFVSAKPVKFGSIAESLDSMRVSHTSGHNGEYGTEVGLLFEGEVVWDWPKYNVCSSIYTIGERAFTKILARTKPDQTTCSLFEDLGLLTLETKILLAAQTSADLPFEGNYQDQDANLSVGEPFSLAVCGFITWVMENTEEGKKKRQLAINQGWKGREAHIFANWVREIGLQNACKIPTTTRCIALGGDKEIILTAFRRDGREDGYVHGRPGLFMFQDQKNCFVASTTIDALRIFLNKNSYGKIRTVKDNEVVQFRK